MDQSKTNLPHLTQNTKSTQNLWKLRTHLTGALLHTQTLKGKKALGYYNLLQWPHDCNLTLNIILEVLQQLSSDLQCIPEVLYLQLDNCYRENKNRYVFGFCALLIRLKIFRKVFKYYTLCRDGITEFILDLPMFIDWPAAVK